MKKNISKKIFVIAFCLNVLCLTKIYSEEQIVRSQDNLFLANSQHNNNNNNNNNNNLDYDDYDEEIVIYEPGIKINPYCCCSTFILGLLKYFGFF